MLTAEDAFQRAVAGDAENRTGRAAGTCEAGGRRAVGHGRLACICRVPPLATTTADAEGCGRRAPFWALRKPATM